MKSPAVLLVLLILTVAAVLAASILLVSEPGDEEIELTPMERRSSRDQPDAVQADIPSAQTNGDVPLVSPLAEPDVSREEIKPRTSWSWAPVDLLLEVREIPSLTRIPAHEITFQVYQNDNLSPLVPQQAGDNGLFTLTDLVPGDYRIEASTGDGKQGRMSLRARAGSRLRETLLVGAPSPLEIKVLRHKTSNPIVGAYIDVKDSVNRGRTDDAGLFRSKHALRPDPDLTVRISKQGYFTTFLRPFAPDRLESGAKPPHKVTLTPLGGSARFSGTLMDQNGQPLTRWGLRLSPGGKVPPGAGGTTKEVFSAAVTSHKGAFTFTDLTPGDYLLEGLLKNWVDPSAVDFPALFCEKVTIPASGSLEGREIVCQLAPISIQGILLEMESLQPIAGLEIACNGYHDAAQRGLGSDPHHFETVVSDSEGRFVIERAFLPSELSILLMRTGLRINLPDGESEIYRLQHGTDLINSLIHDLLQGFPIKIWLHGRGQIRLPGRVTDVHGTPIKGALVEAKPLATRDRQRYRVLSAEDGGFVLGNLFPGRWAVTALLPSGPTIESVVTLSSSKVPALLKLHAAGSCSIEGKVDLSKAPYFPRITITGNGFAITQQRLRKSGRFSYKYLPAGRTVILVESFEKQRFEENGLMLRQRSVVLVEGRTVTVEM